VLANTLAYAIEYISLKTNNAYKTSEAFRGWGKGGAKGAGGSETEALKPRL